MNSHPSLIIVSAALARPGTRAIPSAGLRRIIHGTHSIRGASSRDAFTIGTGSGAELDRRVLRRIHLHAGAIAAESGAIGFALQSAPNRILVVVVRLQIARIYKHVSMGAVRPLN